MRYLISIATVTFLVVTIFFNDLGFFKGETSPGQAYPLGLCIAVMIIAFLGSFGTFFLMQGGVNKSDGGEFLQGVRVSVAASMAVVAVAAFGWGIMIPVWHLLFVLVWHLLLVLVPFLFSVLGYKIMGDSLRSARNSYILFYLMIPTIGILVGLPAVIALVMIVGTFAAIPAANLADT
jgi:hypothetical protein